MLLPESQVFFDRNTEVFLIMLLQKKRIRNTVISFEIDWLLTNNALELSRQGGGLGSGVF